MLANQNELLWYEQFIGIYGEKNVTPYIHYFVCHLDEQVRNHGDISE